MLHDFCFFKFFGEFVIQPDDRLSEHESDYQRQYQEYRKLDQICPVIHAVHASDSLTHSRHAVCERKQRIYHPEECRCNFDRECAACTRYLYHEQDDAYRLSYVSE